MDCIKVVDWLFSETGKKGGIRWYRRKGGLKEFSKKLNLNPARIANRVNKGVSEAYVGLYGRNKTLCFVIIDKKNGWHYIDAGQGKRGQKIRKKFGKFFPNL